MTPDPTKLADELAERFHRLGSSGFNETHSQVLGVTPAEARLVAAALRRPTPPPDVADWWKPDPDDPFWMLEASDGEWLKNEYSKLGTRDATKAMRFPTAADAQKKTWIGGKWFGAKPTEHTWIASQDAPSAPPSDDVEQRHRDAAEEWRFMECRHCSEYEGDFVADLAADFVRFDTERNATLERENAALREDAERWRSLISCQRIRVMGFTHDGNHVGVEFWRQHPEAHPSSDYPQDGCRERFEQFAARNALGGQPS